MARERKSKLRRSAKKEGKQNVYKQLKKMSADEIRAYFDAEEPIADDEVDEIFDRIYPQLFNEIESVKESKPTHKCTWTTRRIVAAAACLTLMLPVVAQAMGAPVWETLVSWTKEHLFIGISHTGNVEEQLGRESFSELERQIWGDDICKALEDVGYYPALPTWKPEEYEPFDLFYMNDGNGYAYVSAQYCDEDENMLNLVLEILPYDSHEYEFSIERDEEQRKEFAADGTQYYLVSNLDTNTAVWQHENVLYQLSGSLEVDTLAEIICSTQYNDKENG